MPGPEPKQARYGLGAPAGTNYSGILECPCTDRYGGDPIFYPDAGTKVMDHQYSVVDAPQCAVADKMETAATCFEGAFAHMPTHTYITYAHTYTHTRTRTHTHVHAHEPPRA